MRSAGCIVNDIIDKDFDGQIERTKDRPLAAGALTQKQAFIAFFVCLGVGAIVWLNINHAAKYVSILAGFMMVIYPFMKRFTYLPQLFLGGTFNSGLIIAFLHVPAVTWAGPLEGILGSITMLVRFIWLLFMALVLWTIFYDTIYAFADIKDDLKANVKSTAILIKNAPKFWLTIINILLHGLLFLFFFKFYQQLGWIVSLPSLFGFIYLQFLLKQWNSDDPISCIHTFGYCHYWGLMLWGWIILLVP